jgi:beta-mannosidase
VPGDEIFGINNYRKSTVRIVHIHTSYDRPKAASGALRWDLFHLGGRRILGGRKTVSLQPMRSVRQKTLDLSGPLEKFGRENLYLRIALDTGGKRVSEETVFLTIPRFMDLPAARTGVRIAMKAPGRAEVSFTSPVFQHRFAFDFEGHAFSASDNFFDLYPDERRRVEVEFAGPVTLAGLRRSISHRSLVDSY